MFDYNSLSQIIILYLLFIILTTIFFLLFSEYNLLIGLIYLELSFVSLILLISFFAVILDDFYPVAFSVILLILAAGDSVIAISFLIYLNRVGQSQSGVSYLIIFKLYLLLVWRCGVSLWNFFLNAGILCCVFCVGFLGSFYLF